MGPRRRGSGVPEVAPLLLSHSQTLSVTQALSYSVGSGVDTSPAWLLPRPNYSLVIPVSSLGCSWVTVCIFWVWQTQRLESPFPVPVLICSCSCGGYLCFPRWLLLG